MNIPFPNRTFSQNFLSGYVSTGLIGFYFFTEYQALRKNFCLFLEQVTKILQTFFLKICLNSLICIPKMNHKRICL